MDYTIVLGVDEGHIEHLRTVVPTWRNKPNTYFGHSIVIFYDFDGVGSCPYFEDMVNIMKDHSNVVYLPWPPPNVIYEDDTTSRFGRSQRYKMLAGFVHVPAMVVKTPYWLKIDLDVIPLSRDTWVDNEWFKGSPVIVASSWGYTKPADQILKLDQWVEENQQLLLPMANTEPLGLAPEPGSNLVKHSRIISWCAFFETRFTNLVSVMAHDTAGWCKLPVPSQDGYMWYCAKRMGLPIRTVNMKSLGWSHCSGLQSVKAKVLEIGQE